MEHKSKAKIISCNFDNTAICAGAARISTTEGDSDQVFEKSKNNPNNEKLIKKVLKSGHRSTVEHAVFTLSMRNVSVYVEQFFIEFRLASFTVKSRRYVILPVRAIIFRMACRRLSRTSIADIWICFSAHIKSFF